MLAVIFEVEPQEAHSATYFDIAAELKPLVEKIDGFIGIERFASVNQPGRLLSLSYWRDEAAIKQWREQEAHRDAQSRGKRELFTRYRIRVAQVIREYGSENPRQSLKVFD